MFTRVLLSPLQKDIKLIQMLSSNVTNKCFIIWLVVLQGYQLRIHSFKKLKKNREIPTLHYPPEKTFSLFLYPTLKTIVFM